MTSGLYGSDQNTPDSYSYVLGGVSKTYILLPSGSLGNNLSIILVLSNTPFINPSSTNIPSLSILFIISPT